MNEACARCGRRSEFIARRYHTDEPLCAECLQIQVPGIPLAQLNSMLTVNKPRLNTCPYCETKAADAIRDGLLGCPLCYETMDDTVWRHFGITRGNWTKSPAEETHG